MRTLSNSAQQISEWNWSLMQCCISKPHKYHAVSIHQKLKTSRQNDLKNIIFVDFNFSFSHSYSHILQLTTTKSETTVFWLTNTHLDVHVYREQGRMFRCEKLPFGVLMDTPAAAAPTSLHKFPPQALCRISPPGWARFLCSSKEMDIAVEFWPAHFWVSSSQVWDQGGVCRIICHRENLRHQITTALWERCMIVTFLLLLSKC